MKLFKAGRQFYNIGRYPLFHISSIKKDGKRYILIRLAEPPETELLGMIAGLTPESRTKDHMGKTDHLHVNIYVMVDNEDDEGVARIIEKWPFEEKIVRFLNSEGKNVLDLYRLPTKGG